MARRSCKHPLSARAPRFVGDLCVGVSCRACGDQLPSGPSTDGGEHADQVAIEMRAAEILVRGDMVGIEVTGFVDHEDDDETAAGDPGWLAGWLAAEILDQVEVDRG